MQLPALSPDIIISSLIAVAGLYGLLAGKQRLRLLILSIYVGIVVAEQLSALANAALPGLGADQIGWLLLGLPVLIFGFVGVVHAKNHDKGSAIANIIVGLLSGALIASSALRLLPTSQLSALNSDSFLVSLLSSYHLWFVGLLPVVALILGWLKADKPSH